MSVIVKSVQKWFGAPCIFVSQTEPYIVMFFWFQFRTLFWCSPLSLSLHAYLSRLFKRKNQAWACMRGIYLQVFFLLLYFSSPATASSHGIVSRPDLPQRTGHGFFINNKYIHENDLWNVFGSYLTAHNLSPLVAAVSSSHMSSYSCHVLVWWGWISVGCSTHPGPPLVISW